MHLVLATIAVRGSESPVVQHTVSALLKLLTGLLEASLAKLALVWAAFLGLFDNVTDDLVGLVIRSIAQTELGREIVTQWALVLWQAFSGYWLALFLVLAASATLAAAGHLPLAWRAITARRRSIFVSFQNRREAEASQLETALAKGCFRVLRVPYAPGSGHQGVVVAVNDLLRQADAVVCLPGQDASFVEAEVAAATVAHKPVLFLVPIGGTLPNTADKQHPAFVHERVAAQGFAPVTEFLHHITQDFQSACGLYRTAWTHPAVKSTLARALLVLVSASLALFLSALVHGDIVTSSTAAVNVPDAESLRWKTILSIAVVLLGGALVILPLSIWLVLVARSLWVQLRAARRAALRVRTGEFARADWVGIVPGMRPGCHLYDSMQVSAPKAHHEAAATV